MLSVCYNTEMRNKRGHGVVFPGAIFGRLTVVERAGYKGSSPCWIVECECGTKKMVYHQQLTSNPGTKSCGCLAREMSSFRATKHGACRGGKATPLYSTWQAMISRCHNPNAAGYGTHGARGISVCDKWKVSFQAFRDDMGEKPSPNHTVDRIDNDGNYEPSNCRWATSRQQQENRRTTPKFIVDGKQYNTRELCEMLGLSRAALRSRIKRFGLDVAVSMKRYSRPEAVS